LLIIKGKVFMKQNAIYLILVIFVLAGCGGAPATATPSTTTGATREKATSSPSPASDGTATPDPCVLPQLEEEVQKIHRHMREFDDASILASNMPREQLSNSIAELQRIRREAEDEPIPGCLFDLKTYQVEHMNSVIDTLVAFMGGTDQQTLEQGIATARQQHDDYTLELARILGLTVVPVTVPVLNTPVETPTP
jgi:TolA-binding protein